LAIGSYRVEERMRDGAASDALTVRAPKGGSV
jgi:hypothetical protein